MALKLSYTVYWKERRGAHLDKLILCPLKVNYNKELGILIKSEEKKTKWLGQFSIKKR